ncbi:MULTISPECIES: hypothetical protein [Sphingomonas]|uniref:Lipoprotein n=1 Tax=Sphingomonas molluscorum TaxID=418184 RepID=A0ABU8Q5N7_9SPHN|nr:hypothetical protein [Sphingomonas sp. JUb134]MBM7405933.1 hypothetical protein [Sphingomonas sp. JUb134]
MNVRNGRARGMKLAAAVLPLLLAACSDEAPRSDPALPPHAAATSLPPAMLGRWGEDAACAQPLEVAADRIADARIDAVTTAADGAVDVDTSAEVDGITTGRRYRLARSRGERLAVTVDGITTTRIRCP